MVDVSGAKFSKELLGPEGLEVVDEELPELEDVVPVANVIKLYIDAIYDCSY